MTVSDLVRYGISERLVNLWRERQGEMLLAIQKRAIIQGLLVDRGGRENGIGENLLILAPTSAGKSFCGEMATARMLSQRRKVIHLVPLKVLAEQQAARYRSLYGDMGLRSLVLSSDHPSHNACFGRGEYDVAFAIYEKLDLALTVNFDLLANVGLIVVDELQLIADPCRGPVLERLLARVKRSLYGPRLIGLSAVLRSHQPGVAQLAEWLEARVIEEHSRPVDLKVGVACRGRWRYRCCNSGVQGEGEFPFDEDLIGSLVRYVSTRPEKVLVFVKSRRDTLEGALGIAAQVDFPEAKMAIDRLERLEPSHLNRSLIQALRRGVAFHNSDMTARQRRIVERAYREGEVRLLVATTTLAMGVNLAADTVFLETVKYAVGAYRERPALVPISRFEFENMVGRAGRCDRKGESCEGRGVVLAENEFEQEVLCQTYLTGEGEVALTSSLERLDAADWCLNLVVSGMVGGVDDLVASYRNTWWASLEPKRDFAERVSEAVGQLEKGGFVELDSEGRLRASETGRVVACRGLGWRQGEYIMRALDDGIPAGSAGWLAVAVGTPGLELPPGLLSRGEFGDNLPLRQAYHRWGELPPEVERLLFPDRRQRPMEYSRAAGLKALLVLEDWCAMESAITLEERWQVHLGQVMSLAGSVAHLVAAAGVMASEIGLSGDCREEVENLVFSLRSGLIPELGSLAVFLSLGLDRHDLASLHRADLDTFEALSQTDSGRLQQILKCCDKVRLINEITAKHKQEVDVGSMSTGQVWTGNVRPVVSRLESLEVDGACQADRYLVRINGFPVRLTGKSFKYLVKLAWSRLHRDSGWMYKEEIEAGFNQARYLYRMKQEIAGAVPVMGNLVQNNRLGYYRLNIEPSQISINHDRLHEHEDYEIRQLAGEQKAS
jgi:helicase